MRKYFSQVTVLLTKEDEKILDDIKKETHIDSNADIMRIALREKATKKEDS